MSRETICAICALSVWGAIASTDNNRVSSDEILARVADTTARRLAVPYSGFREYNIRNHRFGKSARISVNIAYRPGEGMRFTVLQRSGSTKLGGIVERILASEAGETRPGNSKTHEIGPSNYHTYLVGLENVNGRRCYIVGLKPRHRSKYLIDGTIWVDSESYGLVRLEGETAASVSLWVGTPRITEHFIEVGGLWLPSYVYSASSGMWLGTSELEIRYTNYQVGIAGQGIGSIPAPPSAQRAPRTPGAASYCGDLFRQAAGGLSRPLGCLDRSRETLASWPSFGSVVTPKNGAWFLSRMSLTM